MGDSKTVLSQLIGLGGPFEVETVNIRGVETKSWKTAPKNLNEVFRSTKAHRDRTFLVYEDERLSYREVHEIVGKIQRYLREQGVVKGSRVAIAMRNYPEWIAAFYAIVAMGAIAVPLNSWWSGSELTYGLIDSESGILICDQERLLALSSHLEELKEMDPSFKILTVRTNEDQVEGAMQGVEFDRFETLIKGPAVEAEGVEIEPDDVAAIFYTSGTTGKPKGAVISHRNIIGCMMNAFFSATYRSMLSGTDPKNGSVEGEDQGSGSGEQNCVLLSVPLFHATGCFATLIPNSVAGSKIVLMYKWDPGKALEIIEQERVTTFGGVPAMVWQVINHPDFHSYDTSSVQGIGYGGAPSAPELVRKIKEYFPTSAPTNGYGLTETAAIVTLNVGDDYVRKPDSAGPPMPVMELRIVDPLGLDLPRGEVGELWIKGPTVIKGYWKKEKETQQTFENGWLKTGDIAYLDDENFLHIVDRSKDVVIRGGENVYSVEVEAAIFEHPGVADVAVVGLPDQVLGEEVCAVIQPKPNFSLTQSEIQEHVAKRLARFKVPKYVYFTDKDLPRNAAGKVLKRELRDEAHRYIIETASM
ncbi:long-chain acyl-CoA synthetase [Ferrithrix thermotolerans DSM 19514]|uniref:Long-chain acyl-CoA synthetase n=1 Tax=Ferrithrix thermotolerans DSM 19514 TaxID=1121881 RepID=A0A1M4S4T0_9ACTN|nr:class I adenylate-forming enzyme family protein [Ferrithrix thermotolerans]SHE27216.1 long-chain acyl-CoA synthetase [Ferrithrix thermotolerans DSM 19514]